ncbi:hypothetical protein [Paucisalibacillus globulus]|uniref:hypothetical protein n=1 Tax=Paucisalibacillus globulus TaxID=351095 RepID=UPI000BB86B0A|nr:hypothetical protein [Paucisalibacillus globulus]
MLLIGIVLGIYIGYKLNDLIRKLNIGIEFKILGLKVTIGKPKKAPVVDIAKKKKKVTSVKSKCVTCNDEDMFIAGTNNLIPCPKCKRNSDKFKKNLV